MYMVYRVNEKVYLGLVKIVNGKAAHGSGAVCVWVLYSYW